MRNNRSPFPVSNMTNALVHSVHGKPLLSWMFIISLLIVAAGCAQKEHERIDASEAFPQRIVSLLPSLTEIVYSLGAGDRIAGVSDFCTYPEDVSNKPRVGGLVNPNIEATLSLHPDLILLQKSQQDLEDKYARLGLPVLSLNSEKLDDIMHSISLIGNRLGLRKEADSLKERIQQDFDIIRKKVEGLEKIKTLIVIGHEPGSLRDIWVSSSSSFHNEMLEIAGGENMIHDSLAAYPKVSKEEILRSSPSAIIVLFSYPLSIEDQQDEIDLWKPLGYIDAYKNNRICIIGEEWAHKSGPRMPRIANAFYHCLHGKKKETL